MKIEPKYVSYPNAVLLNEKGFDVICSYGSAILGDKLEAMIITY